MTTPAAEALYLEQHRSIYSGMPWAIFNPHDKPTEELPVIYGFNNGGSPGWYAAELLAEDGTPLGGHLCSHEGYMEADLGIVEGSRPDRHENFKKHYPDGYRMEFVPFNCVENHAKLNAVFEKHDKLNPSN